MQNINDILAEKFCEIAKMQPERKYHLMIRNYFDVRSDEILLDGVFTINELLIMIETIQEMDELNDSM